MMKFKILIIVFLTPILNVNAQILRGVVYDNTTSKPIPFASLSIINSSIGTVTNLEGAFSLKINSDSDSIIISHINYGLNYFKIVREKKENKIFKMDPIDFELDEIVVTSSVESIPEILYKTAIRSEEQLSLPIYLDTYYREFVKTNENYTKYSDGIITYHLERKGKQKIKTKVWVKESRAFELYDEKEEDIDWDLTSPLDLRKSLGTASISNLKKFIDIEIEAKYEFNMKTRQMKNGQQWEIIEITPKQNLQEMRHTITISIDSKTGLIMEIDYQLYERHKKFAKEINLLGLKLKVLESKRKIVFSKSDTHYNVLYALKDKTLRIWNKKNIDEKFRFSNDLLVTGIFSNGSNLNKENLYNKKSLYKRGNSNKTEFWLNSNAIELTTEQQKIIDSLK
jgi:hypothetical protein